MFVAVAVNVTLVPVQMAPLGLAAILTLAVTSGLIVAVTGVRALLQADSCINQL